MKTPIPPVGRFCLHVFFALLAVYLNDPVAHAQVPVTFTNNTAITILDSASPPTAASVYPSNIAVSGLGNLTQLTLTISGFSDAHPDDVDMMVVGPLGQKFVFWADAGGSTSVNNLNITLSDSAVANLPQTTGLTSGTFKPTAYGGHTFPAPAPASPSSAAPFGTSTFTTLFNGQSPDGTWSLYVIDDTSGNSGSISGGWSLTLTAPAIPEPQTWALLMMGGLMGLVIFRRKERLTGH